MERVIGRIPALSCLQARRRRAHRVHVLRGVRGLDEVLRAAKGIPVEEHERRDLDRMADRQVHQGVVVEADPLPLWQPGAWLDRGVAAESVVVVLDGVEDPHNFGAIVRSATACGADAVLFAKDRAAPVSPAAVKSAAGAMEYMDLIQATNLARSLELLKQAGYWVAALEAEAPQALWEAPLTGRIALVVGSEGKGVRRLIKDKSDWLLQIPLSGPITSLNASNAAAIALAECLRQRRARDA